MAKKMGRPTKGRNDVTARMDAELLRKVKFVSQYKGETIAELLTRIVEPIIDREMRELAVLEVERTKPKPPK